MRVSVLLAVVATLYAALLCAQASASMFPGFDMLSESMDMAEDQFVQVCEPALGRYRPTALKYLGFTDGGNFPAHLLFGALKTGFAKQLLQGAEGEVKDTILEMYGGAIINFMDSRLSDADVCGLTYKAQLAVGQKIASDPEFINKKLSEFGVAVSTNWANIRAEVMPVIQDLIEQTRHRQVVQSDSDSFGCHAGQTLIRGRCVNCYIYPKECARAFADSDFLFQKPVNKDKKKTESQRKSKKNKNLFRKFFEKLRGKKRDNKKKVVDEDNEVESDSTGPCHAGQSLIRGRCVNCTLYPRDCARAFADSDFLFAVNKDKKKREGSQRPKKKNNFFRKFLEKLRGKKKEKTNNKNKDKVDNESESDSLGCHAGQSYINGRCINCTLYPRECSRAWADEIESDFNIKKLLQKLLKKKNKKNKVVDEEDNEVESDSTGPCHAGQTYINGRCVNCTLYPSECRSRRF